MNNQNTVSKLVSDIMSKNYSDAKNGLHNLLHSKSIEHIATRKQEIAETMLQNEERVDEMTSNRAYQMDKRGEFYSEWDEDSQMYCVFGSESGFCYATYAGKEEAEEEAQRMNIALNKTL